MNHTSTSSRTWLILTHTLCKVDISKQVVKLLGSSNTNIPISHSIHVWYIFPTLTIRINHSWMGKYTSPMDSAGLVKKKPNRFDKGLQRGGGLNMFLFFCFSLSRPRLGTRVVLPVEEMLWDTYHIFDPYDDGGGRTGLNCH